MKVQVAPSFFESLKRIGSFSEKLKELKMWFRYHFRKEYRKLLKTTLKSYPFDYSYLYEIEQAKINEMIEYHKKADRFVGVEYVIRDMKIASSLIDIFIGKKNIFHYDGELTYTKNEDGVTYTMGTSPDFKYNCDVKVNTRNIDRFIKDEKAKEFYLKSPHELYMIKAKYLYHKIRYEKDFEWWD